MTAPQDGWTEKAQSRAGPISPELLKLWEALARNDDCISMFTSDDIRLMLGEIRRLDKVVYFFTPDENAINRHRLTTLDDLPCVKNTIPPT